MRYGLPDTTALKIQRVFSRFPQVDRAVLYGSRAKGNPRPGSDIDLALVGGNLDQTLLGKIDDQLDDLLLPYRIDLSILSKIAHADLLEHINRVGVVFYEKAAN